jgi:hypothetical protein
MKQGYNYTTQFLTLVGELPNNRSQFTYNYKGR